MTQAAKVLVAAAINRAGLNTARRIAGSRGLVVFGTMDGGVLERVVFDGGAAVPVYFYEPG